MIILTEPLPSITLPPETVSACHDYVSEYVKRKGTYYQEQRGATIDRMPQQLLIGKLAEFAAPIFLGLESQPDLSIHLQSNWDPDLSHDGYHVHVKSWEMGSLFPESYGIQLTDDLFTKPIRSIDHMALIRVSSDGYCQLRAFAPWSVLKPLCRAPIKKEFLGEKLFIYAADLLRMADLASL